MNREQLAAKDLNKTAIVHPSKKVDINYLLAKVRQKKNEEKKGNYIFLGLICAVVTVTGIIASL